MDLALREIWFSRVSGSGGAGGRGLPFFPWRSVSAS